MILFQGSFREGTRENGVSDVKVFKNANSALYYTILHIQSQKFSGGDKSRISAMHQTPISAWLASVPVVHVIRNDHSIVPFCSVVGRNSPHRDITKVNDIIQFNFAAEAICHIHPKAVLKIRPVSKYESRDRLRQDSAQLIICATTETCSQ